tara:strand:+ start:69 stop:470 length:402 start_codon:yes stop_codon:yes gene_type:complete
LQTIYSRALINNLKNQKTVEGPSHCGSKPKKIAIGIAPLGFISIGIVAMGVISIGVVAMRVGNASKVGMGIFSAGITTMGLKVWNPENTAIQESLNSSNSSSSKNIYAYRTKSQAETEAKKLDCVGVHKMGKL